MPKITVTAERLNPRWLIPKADLTQANFKGVAPEIIFPTRARFEGVFDGRATVGVMLDADGNATDFLLIRYSRPYFGDELMRAIHNEKFSPRRIKGVAIPGRFYVNQRFYLNGTVSMTPMDAIAEFTNRITNALDGPPFVFQPHLEHEIDGGKLQFTAVTEPLLPGGFEVVAGQPLKVIVSFYVDEKGNVRLPNVESNTPSRLIPSLVKALTAWSFVPPTIGGKPALLFAVRSITLDAGSLPNGSEIPRAAGDTGNR